MGTVIIGLIVFGLFAWVSVHLYNEHKESKKSHGCSGGCCGCSKSTSCHK